MQHLDEGTIHAWLDGALEVEEAARVEQHAAECAQCAAAIAEARGLVAASSRILSALDHVPGGVTVGRGAGGVGRGEPLGKARQARPLRRVLHFTPMRAAAAAIVILAVGTTLVLRHASDEPGPIDTEAGPANVAPPTAAAPIIGGVPKAAASKVAPSKMAPKVERFSAPPRRVANAEIPVAAPSVEQRAAVRSVPHVAAAAAPSPVPSPPAADTVAVRNQAVVAVADSASRMRLKSNLAAEVARRGVIAGQPAPSQPKPASLALEQVVVTGLATGASAAAPNSTRALAGCYHVTADSALGLPGRIVIDSTRYGRSLAGSKLADQVSPANVRWQAIPGGGIRLQTGAPTSVSVDLHPSSPTTFAGSTTLGGRTVTVTLRRLGDCSAR